MLAPWPVPSESITTFFAMLSLRSYPSLISAETARSRVATSAQEIDQTGLAARDLADLCYLCAALLCAALPRRLL
jgi:hypothetical protein